MTTADADNDDDDDEEDDDDDFDDDVVNQKSSTRHAHDFRGHALLFLISEVMHHVTATHADAFRQHRI